MPTYIYSCECGAQREVLHSMSASVAIVCPQCMAEMTRKPAVGAVTFTGEGWGKDS